MESIKLILPKLLFNKEDFCILCFKHLDDSSKRTFRKDQVRFEEETIDTDHLSEIFDYIFNQESLSTMSLGNAICRKCRISAIASYNFIKTCKENAHNLSKAIESISDSFDNTVEDISQYNSLFVCLKTEDFTSQQYYDDKRPVSTISAVCKRLRSITSAKIKNKIKEEDNEDIFQIDSSKKVLKANKIRRENKSFTNKYDIESVPTEDILLDSTNPANLTCKVCFTLFRDVTKLRIHYFRKHYPRRIKCTKCIKKFISQKVLKDHMDEYHSTAICKVCGKSFTSKYILRRHEENHNVKICCQDCGRLYRSKEAYRKHKTDSVCQQKTRKSSHEGTYQCEYCKKRYCYKPYLAKHIKYEHSNAEGYKCKFCNKKLYTLSNLQAHLVKHTLEKKFECDICGGKFGTKTTLLYHTRLHTGEKPYKCDHCDKAFLSASRRLDHVRRHHLAPAFECDICHSKFKATSSFLKHKRRHLNPNSRLNVMYAAVPNNSVS